MEQEFKYKILEYTNRAKKYPFREWFLDLDAMAAAKVTTAIIRLENGNTSNVKSVGSGVYEFKINFGPGYRIYFAYDGKNIILLLAGGTKKGSQKISKLQKKGGLIIRPESR